jgi:dual-specificity kinase
MSPSNPAATTRRSRVRHRTPDWDNFYKNGLPKEIIVIDDDSPAPPPAEDEYGDHSPHRATNYHPATVRPAPSNGQVRHVDKRRKTADVGKAYDPVYHKQVQSSTHDQGPYYNDDSPTTSASTGRTASALTTTAATSLGSNHSYGNNGVNGRYGEIEQVGQKRKRTRKAAADEAKQREIEIQGDAYSSYCPPPKPPIKAKDVYVVVAPDVSPSLFSMPQHAGTDHSVASSLETSQGR